MSTTRSAWARMDSLRPIDKAVVLVEPGVVFVDTAVSVSVQVIDREGARAAGIPAQESRYYLDGYRSGTGMVVNPKGWVVTASHVVRPDEQERRRIISYAVNQLFFQGDTGYSLSEQADLFDQHRTGSPALDELLRRCYNEAACRFNIEPTVTVLTPAHIASGSTTDGLPARVVPFTGFEESDVAILRVDASNMPTVPLAASIAGIKSDQFVTILGFPGSAQDPPSGATEPIKLLGRINVRSEGADPFYETSARLSQGMSGGPSTNLAGQVVGLASFNTDDASDVHHARLLPVDDIRSVLHRANVEAVRGEVDQVFEQAMGYFWDHHYSAVIPLYRQVLRLHRGHPLATWYLTQADAKAGGPEDVRLPATAAKGLIVRAIRLLVPVVGVIILLAAIRRYRLSMGIGPVRATTLRASVLRRKPGVRVRR